MDVVKLIYFNYIFVAKIYKLKFKFHYLPYKISILLFRGVGYILFIRGGVSILSVLNLTDLFSNQRINSHRKKYSKFFVEYLKTVHFLGKF